MKRAGLALVLWGVAAFLATAAACLQGAIAFADWAVTQGERAGTLSTALAVQEERAFFTAVRAGHLRPVYYGTRVYAWRPADSTARCWPATP